MQCDYSMTRWGIHVGLNTSLISSNVLTLQMLFKSIFALALLATVAATPPPLTELEELLKRAINGFHDQKGVPDPNDVPRVSAVNCVTNYL